MPHPGPRPTPPWLRICPGPASALALDLDWQKLSHGPCPTPPRLCRCPGPTFTLALALPWHYSGSPTHPPFVLIIDGVPRGRPKDPLGRKTMCGSTWVEERESVSGLACRLTKQGGIQFVLAFHARTVLSRRYRLYIYVGINLAGSAKIPSPTQLIYHQF